MSDTSALLQDGSGDSGLFGETIWFAHPDSNIELYPQIGSITQLKLFHAL
jgi:hypothetical protein